jgi:hypothetical protein
MDFEMLQTGHSDMDSVGPTIESVMTAMGREPVMPVINSEVNYEGILGRAWQNVQRLCFYHGALRGLAGHTYGANGIWQMSTVGNPYGPSPHGVCWGNTPWREAMYLPGSRQVALGGAFMRGLEWWRLERFPAWVDEPDRENDPYGTVAVGIPRLLRVIYIPLCWHGPVIRQMESDVTYKARYFDPCTGNTHELGEALGDSNGNWHAPIPPECHDWLLVLEA